MFTMAELNTLCETYGIGRPMLTNSLLKSDAHAGYTLLTTEGQFVLVPVDPQRSLVAVGYEHQLIRYLAQHAFPVSEPFVTRYGTTVSLLSGQLYALFATADYTPYNPENPYHLHQAAQALALLHQLLDSYPQTILTCNQVHMLDSFGESARSIVTQLERSSSNIFRRSSSLQRSFDLLRQQICQLEGELHCRTSCQLPQGLIHACYTPAQLLFDHERLMAVTSFAKLTYAPRLYDLAYAMVHFAQVHARTQPHCENDPEVLRQFLSHYCALQALTNQELAELPLLMRPIWLLVGLEQLLRESIYLNMQQLLTNLKQLSAALDRLELYNGSLYEGFALEVSV